MSDSYCVNSVSNAVSLHVTAKCHTCSIGTLGCAGDYRREIETDSAVRIRVCAAEQPQDGDSHSQGKHHEAVGRPLPAGALRCPQFTS